MALLTRSPGARRVTAVLAAAVSLLGLGGSSVLAEERAPEYAIKATYLYKLAPFVDWPAAALPGGGPFTICVFGDDPFGPQLDRAVGGQSIAGRSISVRRLQVTPQDLDCQVLYLGRSRSQSATGLLRAVRGRPVLTVTDESQGSSGGMVQFELRDGRVRFSLDAASASASGLSFSSKLQALATKVRRVGE